MQVTVKRKEKISVLFQGWTQIPHSYASVNCFQLIHLYNNYNKYIDIYIQEMPYFREHWNNAKKLVYGEKYNNILRNLKEFNGEYIDLVYSITYPYNINNSFDKLPKLHFEHYNTKEPLMNFESLHYTNTIGILYNKLNNI